MPRHALLFHRLTCALALAGGCLAAGRVEAEEAAGKPIPVKLEGSFEQGWRLLRGGEPYTINGVGGSGSLELLAACGGNSIRTWGVDAGTGKLLDEAHRHGLTVTLGIWLGHERHGFRYDDFEQVSAQLRAVEEAVRQYKDHPALLMWGLGNEMEGYGRGDNPAIWSHVETAAALVKRLDPHHPTMSVVAEIGGGRVAAIHRLCPSLDCVGINAYAGAATLPQRYRRAGGRKPYLLTEYGPPGRWEVPADELGAPPEPSSTAKGKFYAASYDAVHGDRGLALGSYAFLWGVKQEATATWFGMLLPDGAKLEAVDVLTERWSGAPPKNRVPKIEKLAIAGPRSLQPGAEVTAQLTARDPEGEELQVRWELREDLQEYGEGGDAEAVPAAVPEAILRSTSEEARLKMPADGGLYRLFVYVRDGAGGGATANLPLRVMGPKAFRPGAETTLPLVVYAEGEEQSFAASGWMGNLEAIGLELQSKESPRSGEHCLAAEYRAAGEWGGVVWQHPAGDWGERPGGYQLEKAKSLTFWARGAAGGERVKFGFGLLDGRQPFRDTAKGELEVELTREWKRYSLPLAGLDLRRIKSGFYWTLAGQGKPLRFFLDDIAFE